MIFGKEISDTLDTFSPAEAPAAPPLRERSDIPDRFKWDLSHIYPDWNAWQRAYDELDRKIGECATFQGTLAQGAGRLIRRSTDTGVVAVLDPRLANSASYRWEIVSALPPMPSRASIAS